MPMTARGGIMGNWESAPAAAPNDAPIRLRPARDPLHVEAAPLPEGMAGRIMRIYGETEILVNRAIPRRHRRAVARHCMARHEEHCIVEDCVAARGWLRQSVVLRLVGEESA